MEKIPSALLKAFAQIRRDIAREDDGSSLLRHVVDRLREVAGCEQAWAVHWDGRRALATTRTPPREGSPGSRLDDAELPPCLSNRDGCAACRLTAVCSGSPGLIPLRAQGRCAGALAIDGDLCLADAAELWTELAEDLALALRRLQRLRDLTRRDRMRVEMEKLGELGGWELDLLEGQADWTEGVAGIHDLDQDAPAPGKQGGLEFYAPESRRVLEAAVEQATADGTGYDLELQLISATGARKWVRSLGRGLVEQGRVVKVSGLLQDVTRRKAIEEELRVSRQRLDAIFERAGIGLAECATQSGAFQRVNRKLCEILGYTAEELLAKNWVELSHPDDREQDQQRSLDLRQGRLFHTALEKRYLRKDGVYLWVRVNLAPQLESGNCILSVEDISKRYLALQALQEQQKRLSTMFELMLAGVILVRLSDSRILQVNPAMERLLERSAAELQGKCLLDLQVFPHPEELDEIARRLKHSESSPAECRLLRKNGEEACCLMTSGAAELDGEVCAVTIWHDVTELRHSDAALRERDRQTRVMFQMAPVGIAMGDPATGRLLAANPRYCAITGYSLEELLSMTVAQLNHPDDARQTSPEFASAMRGEISEFHVDKRYLRKDGGTAWVRIDVSILRDEEGKPARTLAVVEDVTQAKDAERKLEETRQQLLAAQKMEAIGRLAGGIAHDFNNLLTIILSYAELILLDLPVDAPLRADLMEIARAANRAKGLTGQLLAFSRRQMMTLETIDLNSLVTSLDRMLERLLGMDVSLRLKLDRQAVLVLADRGQLEQVILNLAVNASDAMPDGGSLHIATGSCQLDAEKAASLEVPAGGYGLLEIRDTGCGMPPDVMERVFEPFFTTKGLGKGTGLGLAMVYGIVRQTGGAIELESHPGEGTSFRLYLPGSQDERPAPAPTLSDDSRGGNETVLVVEDEPALLEFVKRVLESAGYRVLPAASGPDAITVCQNLGQDVELVLTDVIMPGMNGPNLLARLRPFCPKARFLLMSGYPDDALAGQGIVDYLPKPFDAASLRLAVRAALESSSRCSGGACPGGH